MKNVVVFYFVVFTVMFTSCADAGWTQFAADGYSVPVTGIIYDNTYRRPVSGIPIGGIDTGCFDIETTGLMGYSSIFNHLEARGGPVNIPLFGFSIGGYTWVLTNGKTKVYDDGTHHATFTEGTPLSLTPSRKVKDIHYWGHYPILDMTFTYNTGQQPPVDVSIRGWCPFIPGDTAISNTPGSIFEVKLVNTTAGPQSGTFVFNFPRFSSHVSQRTRDVIPEPAEVVTRQYLNTNLKGVAVEDAGRKTSYVLAVIDESAPVRVGGELGISGSAWNSIAASLPTVTADNGGSTVAVDFNLAAGQTKTIRYVFAWYAPDWKGNGNPFYTGTPGTGGRISECYIFEQGTWNGGVGAHLVATMNYASNPRSNPISYNYTFPVAAGQRVALYFTKAAGEQYDDFCAGDMTVEILDGSLAGQSWNLKTNWSDTQNPRARWEYGGAGGGGWDLLNVHQSDWLPTDLYDPNPQPAWSDTQGGVPGWAKCVNDSPYGKDILTGDVFCHGPASARWISPAACTVRVSGQAWMIRDATAVPANTFTHMYAARYPDAVSVAALLAQRHPELLSRIIAWQEAIYKDPATPGWLADSLINILHLVTETSVWAQVKNPVSPAFNVNDGLFGMNESPRGCPQIECVPCSFYGSLPLTYFWPDLQLSNLRGYKRYQAQDGRPSWIFGSSFEMVSPGYTQYQASTNGISLAGIVDRFLMCRDEDKQYLQEFYPMIKKLMSYNVNLGIAGNPAYSLGEQVVAMPNIEGNLEWFEAPEPGWQGVAAHVAILRLAQLGITRRMAEQMGDTAYTAQCDQWTQLAAAAIENRLWDTRGYYLNFREPVSGTTSELIFGYQMDGEWVMDQHGLSSPLPVNHVQTALETIKNANVALSQSGAVNYTNPDGSPAPVGGYGTYSYFPPELMMLAMNYMYEGQKEFGVELLRRCMENIAVTWGYTWDAPNIMRGDQDTGERTFGADYYQDMMLWAAPAAISNQSLDKPAKPGALVDRVIRAGSYTKKHTADMTADAWSGWTNQGSYAAGLPDSSDAGTWDMVWYDNLEPTQLNTMQCWTYPDAGTPKLAWGYSWNGMHDGGWTNYVGFETMNPAAGVLKVRSNGVSTSCMRWTSGVKGLATFTVGIFDAGNLPGTTWMGAHYLGVYRVSDGVWMGDTTYNPVNGSAYTGSGPLSITFTDYVSPGRQYLIAYRGDGQSMAAAFGTIDVEVCAADTTVDAWHGWTAPGSYAAGLLDSSGSGTWDAVWYDNLNPAQLNTMKCWAYPLSGNPTAWGYSWDGTRDTGWNAYVGFKTMDPAIGVLKVRSNGASTSCMRWTSGKQGIAAFKVKIYNGLGAWSGSHYLGVYRVADGVWMDDTTYNPVNGSAYTGSGPLYLEFTDSVVPGSQYLIAYRGSAAANMAALSAAIDVEELIADMPANAWNGWTAQGNDAAGLPDSSAAGTWDAVWFDNLNPAQLNTMRCWAYPEAGTPKVAWGYSWNGTHDSGWNAYVGFETMNPATGVLKVRSNGASASCMRWTSGTEGAATLTFTIFDAGNLPGATWQGPHYFGVYRVSDGVWMGDASHNPVNGVAYTGAGPLSISFTDNVAPGDQYLIAYRGGSANAMAALSGTIHRQVAASPCTPLHGDFEPDCDVDLDDLRLLAAQWLQTCGDCQGADLFVDGIVNLKDFSLFAENWLSQ